MKPIMILAGYQAIRILFSGTRSFAQVYIDGSMYYVSDVEFQDFLLRMAAAGAVEASFEGEHKIPVYKLNWRKNHIEIYKEKFETNEYRQWVENAQVILTDFEGQEFDKQLVIEKYACTKEQAKFYLRYLHFLGKLEYIYDNEVKRGVWVVKASFTERIGRLIGIFSKPAKLKR